MNRLKKFLKTTLIGGLVVILPVAILAFAAKWIFGLVSDGIRPLATVLEQHIKHHGFVVDIIAILLVLTICFLVGLAVKTRLGKWIYAGVDNKILKKAPGYSIIKETVLQFIGNKKSPFSSVALVKIFGNNTLMTAFVTDTHKDGTHTVFVPTGPNPTSGNIYHLEDKHVYSIDVSVEETMRSIISCGAGSQKLIDAMNS